MLSFAFPHGGSKTAMMPCIRTQGHKDTGHTEIQNENAGFKDGIRAGKKGKWSQTATKISHEAVVMLFLFLSLVVTVLNQAELFGDTPGTNATKDTRITSFHFGNDTKTMEGTGAAQTMTNYMQEICYETKTFVMPFFATQDSAREISRNFGKHDEFEEHGPGNSQIGSNMEFEHSTQRPRFLSASVEGYLNLDLAPKGCLTKNNNMHSDKGSITAHSFPDHSQDHGHSAGATRLVGAQVCSCDILDFGLDFATEHDAMSTYDSHCNRNHSTNRLRHGFSHGTQTDNSIPQTNVLDWSAVLLYVHGEPHATRYTAYAEGRGVHNASHTRSKGKPPHATCAQRALSTTKITPTHRPLWVVCTPRGNGHLP